MIRIAHKAYRSIAEDLADKDGIGNPGEMVSVLAIEHRMMFAALECGSSIDLAREFSKDLIKLIECTMEEGAWDFEKQCVR